MGSRNIINYIYTSIIIHYISLYILTNRLRTGIIKLGSGMSDKVVASQSEEESIAQSIVPYDRDDARCRYLGLRSSGFTIREALRLIGKAQSTLSAWRHDEVFADLETRIPELRRELALEYANLEFLRNYRLILEKDYRVIKSSLDKNVVLTAQDHQYLLKLRSHYTPQQLQIIEVLYAADKAGEGFNFTDFVLSMSRTKESITIGTRKRSEPQLSPIVEVESSAKKTNNAKS